MNKNYLKTILSLVIMVLVFSGCQKVVNNTVVEDPGNGDGGEVATSSEENGNETASSSEKQGESSEVTFNFIGQDKDGWNQYRIDKAGLSFKMPSEWESNKKGLCINRGCKYISFKNKNIKVWEPGYAKITLQVYNEKDNEFKKIKSKENFYKWLMNNKLSISGINDITFFNIEEQDEYKMIKINQILSAGGYNAYRYFYYYKPLELLLLFETNEFDPKEEINQKEKVKKDLDIIMEIIEIEKSNSINF